MNSPAEILQIWIGNSVKKATLPTFKMILLGIAAGIYMASAATAFFCPRRLLRQFSKPVLPNWSVPRSSLSD